jgi:hypothetical protein
MFFISFCGSHGYELRQGTALHFPSSYCSIYCPIRTAQGRAPAQRLAAASVRDRSKPLAFESVRAIFSSPTRAASMCQPYKTFMRPKWRCKLGVPMLIAEDGAPSLIFAME